MSKLAILLFFVIFMGCVSPTVVDAPRYYWHYTFHINSIDAVRNPELVSIFKDSVNEWDIVLPEAQFEVIIGRNTTQGMLVRLVNIQEHFEENNLNIAGYVNFENIAGLYTSRLGIFIDTDFSGDETYRKSVIMHELGHAFGLPHIVGEDSTDKTSHDIVLGLELDAMMYLMYPTTNAVINISPLEAAMAARRMMPNLGVQSYDGCCWQ